MIERLYAFPPRGRTGRTRGDQRHGSQPLRKEKVLISRICREVNCNRFSRIQEAIRIFSPIQHTLQMKLVPLLPFPSLPFSPPP